MCLWIWLRPRFGVNTRPWGCTLGWLSYATAVTVPVLPSAVVAFRSGLVVEHGRAELLLS